MSLSSKSSRRNSLSSLFNLGNNADNAQHERNLHDCSTTGKPTHLFRTKCVSLDSV
jgi:hypothetical protein